jgi:hypothetical protein
LSWRILKRLSVLRTASLFTAAVLGTLVAGGGQALAESGGCAAFSGSYNQAGSPTSTDFTYNQGFYAGDKLIVTVHSLGASGEDNYNLSDQTSGTYFATGSQTSGSYTIPATTTDTIEMKIIVFDTTGNDISWSCSPGPTPTQTAQAINFTSSAPAATVGGASYTPTASGGGSGNPVPASPRCRKRAQVTVYTNGATATQNWSK